MRGCDPCYLLAPACTEPAPSFGSCAFRSRWKARCHCGRQLGRGAAGAGRTPSDEQDSTSRHTLQDPFQLTTQLQHTTAAYVRWPVLNEPPTRERRRLPSRSKNVGNDMLICVRNPVCVAPDYAPRFGRDLARTPFDAGQHAPAISAHNVLRFSSLPRPEPYTHGRTACVLVVEFPGLEEYMYQFRRGWPTARTSVVEALLPLESCA
ncbi:hypothetical protein BD309DRAFT_298715 [Dichomitus squalens]|nr:hypothetical protein BD309DRAFT_298715 [Dichomitus squalens]